MVAGMFIAQFGDGDSFSKRNKMTKKKAVAGLAALGLILGVTGTVHAADLIKNGGFETLTNGYGQIGYNTDATGWTTTGYNFVFSATNADNGGVNGRLGNVQLWGPGNGSSNGLHASPNGGNYIAADGAFEVAPIEQVINNLTVGHTYAVGFSWGAAQQTGFDGTTTEQWQVSLGGDSLLTSIAPNDNHGFVDWKSESFQYVASSTSETLSFLAIGTPTGKPPFVLLDGVSMDDVSVPEPTALVGIFAGVLSVGVIARRRARAAKPRA